VKEKPTKWYPGIEFYVHPAMGLCGEQTDENGTQSTYQYLTPEEASDWVSAWLKEEKWERSP
jgi:hypothetical protein